MKNLEKINSIPLPDSIHSVRAYRDDEGIAWVDVVAWRAYTQAEENQRFRDVCHLENEIESLGFQISQDGTIDHLEGRGWMYQVTEPQKETKP